MRSKIRHGGIVKCDVPDCTETFTTYSVLSLSRQQAALAGWLRIKLKTMRGWEQWEIGKGSRAIDVCPGHRPTSIMESVEHRASPR